MEIREWLPGGNVTPVTEMLRRAYSELAEMGFRYLATWQDDETTRVRLEKGFAWVAEEKERLIGTISLCPWTSLSQPAEAYQRRGLWLFHQFGVEPACQRRGVGSQLLEVAEERARREGATELACDTAEGATHLIALYGRKGFEMIGEADFGNTNYKSVILMKPLK